MAIPTRNSAANLTPQAATKGFRESGNFIISSTYQSSDSLKKKNDSGLYQNRPQIAWKGIIDFHNLFQTDSKYAYSYIDMSGQQT